MKCSAENGLVYVYLAIPDFDVIAAVRVGTYPSFVVNRCSLTTEVGKGHQISRTTLLTFGKSRVLQVFHLPYQKITFKFTLKWPKWQENSDLNFQKILFSALALPDL